MSEQQTEKSGYPSRYSPTKFVTAAQYIIELVCEKKAKRDKKDLPLQFWELDAWRNYYVSQLRATHKLLQNYAPRAIINVVRQKNLFSLRPKWIIPLIEQEHKKLLALAAKNQKKEPEKPIIKLPSKRRTAFAPKSGLAKLRALEEKHGED